MLDHPKSTRASFQCGQKNSTLEAAVGDFGDTGAPEKVLLLFQFNQTEYPFWPALLAACKSGSPLSQSWLSSRLATRDYTAAVDLFLKGSKDLCGDPSASEEPRKVSKCPEDNQAIKIRRTRASGQTSFTCSPAWALPKRLLTRDLPSPG
ncbi:hypothetical protein RF11_05514 [Thelohanellus kitauei]|uniref:Uncharacterized protein n=1 Tax=Thelohanellus kitauei TaxID=669202 RepID=A0A0C2IHE2_THEKT|nr:hypothetical protein RF11_05514 [Thelohanellus kitauei]